LRRLMSVARIGGGKGDEIVGFDGLPGLRMIGLEDPSIKRR